MNKEKLTREEIEDQEDIEESKRILNDPDTKWVEWRKLDAELFGSSERPSSKIPQEIAKEAAGAHQGEDFRA